MGGTALLPNNPFRDAIALELGHPWQGCLVFQVHPVAFSLVNFHEVLISLGIGFLQGIQHLAVLGADLVAVVGAIVGAHLQGERNIPQG